MKRINVMTVALGWDNDRPVDSLAGNSNESPYT